MTRLLDPSVAGNLAVAVVGLWVICGCLIAKRRRTGWQRPADTGRQR